jgi:hypothetical protein
MLKAIGAELDLRKLLYRLAVGKVAESPFSAELDAELARLLSMALYGVEDSEKMAKTEGQPFRLQALGDWLKLQLDPDWKVFSDIPEGFQKGVRTGANSKLDRVPEVYEQRVRFRRYELDDFDPWRESSSSLDNNKVQFQLQVKEEKLLGRMKEYERGEAERIWGPTLKLATVMALSKDDGTLRIIHDGTHGVHVNPNLVVPDQLRAPSIREKRRMMAHIRDEGTVRFGLKGDVKSAHRLVRVSMKDWGSQAFLADNKLLVNCVGTQGIGSAAFWWSRLVGGLARAALYLHGQATVWQLVYADDFDWTGEGGQIPEHIILSIAFLQTLGVPWSWGKFGGGVAYEWVGLWADWQRFSTGLSLRRGTWLADYCRKVLDNDRVLIRELNEVLGRFVFGALAVEHVKPLLGPLYAWVAAMPIGAFVPLPGAVRLLLTFLEFIFRSDKWRISFVAKQSEMDRRSRGVFRADARAKGDLIEAGGWKLPSSGDPGDASWISFKLDKVVAPWAYAAGEPFRSIAAIELYTTLVTVMALCKDGDDGLLELSSVEGLTDNRGNSFAVGRMLSTKFPLNIVLMELSLQLHLRHMVLDLHWIPREQNVEADELSNGIFRQFSLDKQVAVDVQQLDFLILPALMKEAESFYGELLAKKRRRQEERVVLKSRRSVERQLGLQMHGPTNLVGFVPQPCLDTFGPKGEVVAVGRLSDFRNSSASLASSQADRVKSGSVRGLTVPQKRKRDPLRTSQPW